MSEKRSGIVRNPFDLPTYQRRLRHLRSLTLRNLQCKKFSWKDVTKLQVYFTLHTDAKNKEFYKSEIVTGSLNPSWQSFDISKYEDEIDIHAKFYVRVWVSSGGKGQGYKLLLDWYIHLSGLVFFSGKQQDKNQPNMLIVGMFDHFFIAPEAPVDSEADSYEAEISAIRSSYTINSLSRVQTVLRAIKQMQASVKRVHRSIEDKLLSSQEKARKLAEQEDLVLRVGQLKNELIWQTTRLQQQKDAHHSLTKCEKEQSDILQETFQQLEKNRFNLNEKRKTYFQTREKYIKESAQLLIRRKQLINELTSCIYPITETQRKDLCICGVRLPNSENFQGQDDTMCAVSLCYTSHLLMMMSYLLDFPLRYVIDFRGSRSQITDHIHSKLTDKDRTFMEDTNAYFNVPERLYETRKNWRPRLLAIRSSIVYIFPLYAKGKEKFQFNYGVFLLNKNISQLRLYCGLSTTDLRLTLPNIKSLLELRLGIQFDHVGLVRPLGDFKDGASIPSIDKLETASSVVSAGRYSVPDSAEDALEVALKEKNVSKSDNNIDSESNSLSVNDLSVNDSSQRDENDLDEKDDLFKPSGDEDLFFKVQLTKKDSDQNSRDSLVNNQKPVNGGSHRNSFIPSPSPASNDSNLLNVNQSNIQRESSVSSLSCDFSSGEETQNSPGNPVFLSSGCDTFGPSDLVGSSEAANGNSAITPEKSNDRDLSTIDFQER